MTDPFESYLAPLPEETGRQISEIVSLVAQLFPQAERSLKYKMPTFETEAGFFAIAAQKHHISIYTCSQETIAPYLATHPATDHGKGCLRFSSNKKVDMTSLEKVIRKALA